MELSKSSAVEPPKTRKRSLPKWTRISTPITPLQGRSECWFLDISVLNALVEGARPTVLSVVDYSTHNLLVWVADATITISRVLHELDALIEKRGAPSIVISDESSEMHDPAIMRWAGARGVQWRYAPVTSPLSGFSGR